MMTELTKQAGQAARELLECAKLKPGALLVIGCSSSEVVGAHIGKGSSLEAAQAIWAGVAPELEKAGVAIAAQCCEHLNRAIILERAVAEQRGYEIVNCVPQLHAGGSFAMTVYGALRDPVAVEACAADAGMDIGGTLIGMHLKRVAVPVRLSMDHIGEALLLCARTRPKYIGGSRAVYQEL